MEGEKPMPRSLLTPGREDLSPWPPVGQVEFGDIIYWNENELDRAFLERHGRQEVFEPSYFKSEKRSDRRLELKRVILARLEGYSLFGPEIENWYMTPERRGPNAPNILHRAIKLATTQKTQARIAQVTNNVAREA